MGLSVWRETSKKKTVYRVCYTPIETLFSNTIKIQDGGSKKATISNDNVIAESDVEVT